jgi:hypothetical protein
MKPRYGEEVGHYGNPPSGAQVMWAHLTLIVWPTVHAMKVVNTYDVLGTKARPRMPIIEPEPERFGVETKET